MFLGLTHSSFPLKMKNAIVLLVILFSFSKVCSHPGKKRHLIGEEVTLPCCEDVEVIECGRGTLWTVFLIIFLIFFILLLLGCIKGLMGLCCPFIGIWGLATMTGHRQSLVCCYETQIAGHPVICDCHDLSSTSHDKHHTGHLYSRTTEFCLNLIFFLAYPVVLCCKCCNCCKQKANTDCVPDCDPEKCYGSQLEEDDVRFVLEQLKLSRDSLKRCMCDAVEQTPLLTDRNEKSIRETDNPGFRNTRSRLRQSNLENDEYIPSLSDVSSNDVDQYELFEERQRQQMMQ